MTMVKDFSEFLSAILLFSFIVLDSFDEGKIIIKNTSIGKNGDAMNLWNVFRAKDGTIKTKVEKVPSCLAVNSTASSCFFLAVHLYVIE